MWTKNVNSPSIGFYWIFLWPTIKFAYGTDSKQKETPIFKSHSLLEIEKILFRIKLCQSKAICICLWLRLLNWNLIGCQPIIITLKIPFSFRTFSLNWNSQTNYQTHCRRMSLYFWWRMLPKRKWKQLALTLYRSYWSIIIEIRKNVIKSEIRIVCKAN